MSAPENHKGFKRFANAFFFSMSGFKACFKTEESFRHEVFLAAIMIPLAFWLGGNPAEKAALISVVVLVLIVEILNTAIERTIDRFSLEKHRLAKEAKDMGSAAVLMALVLAGCVWAIICIPRIFPPHIF